MKYNEIRDRYQDHNYLGKEFIDPYAMIISPIFTKIFLKFNIIPNYVTIMMIISGIIGAMLFCFPNICIKVIGIIFIHIWYILDCSDGEVARITKRFSKFGSEIDYTAHIINHPLFNLAFAISMIYLGRYNNIIISILFMILISLNLISRNLISFEYIYNMKIEKQNISDNRNKLKEIRWYIFGILVHYPNFALIFPLIYLFDKYMYTNICYIYLLVVLLFNIIIISRITLNWIKKIINQ